MSTLQHAFKAAEKLPNDVQEEIGERLLKYVEKYIALSDDIDAGIRQLDAGMGRPGDEVFDRLMRKYGA